MSSTRELTWRVWPVNSLAGGHVAVKEFGAHFECHAKFRASAARRAQVSRQLGARAAPANWIVRVGSVARREPVCSNFRSASSAARAD